MTARMDDATRTGAVVRKPSGNEPAGRCGAVVPHALWGLRLAVHLVAGGQRVPTLWCDRQWHLQSIRRGHVEQRLGRPSVRSAWGQQQLTLAGR